MSFPKKNIQDVPSGIQGRVGLYGELFDLAIGAMTFVVQDLNTSNRLVVGSSPG